MYILYAVKSASITRSSNKSIPSAIWASLCHLKTRCTHQQRYEYLYWLVNQYIRYSDFCYYTLEPLTELLQALCWQIQVNSWHLEKQMKRFSVLNVMKEVSLPENESSLFWNVVSESSVLSDAGKKSWYIRIVVMFCMLHNCQKIMWFRMKIFQKNCKFSYIQTCLKLWH